MDDRSIDAMAERLDRLEREQRRWRCAGAAAILAAAALVVLGVARPRAVEARQAARPAEETRDPAVVVEAQLKLARDALQIIDKTAARGAVVNDPAYHVRYWSVRELGAQIYLSLSDDEPKTQDVEVYLSLPPCAPKGPRTAAFEEHLARMTHWEDRYQPLARNGTLSVLDYLVFRENRLQAEVWLARERLRADGWPVQVP